MHWGILRENEAGFVYVDIDDSYIHELIHIIEGSGYEKPPYFGEPNLVGAHITVIYATEERKGKIVELGKIIHFTPIACTIIQPANWEGIEGACIIEVEAPELDQIRAKYGLPKFEFGYHITIGVKKKVIKNL
jgi:hypothetical protein